MRYLASFVIALAWALWFGGIIALFVFVQTLFATDRSLAVQAAPVLFGAFERVQILLAAFTLIGTFSLWMLTRRRAVMTLFALFAISAALAALSAALITTPMERLRQAGQSSSPEFKRLHGISMLMYVSEAVLLLAAGTIIPGVNAKITAASGETAPGTAPA